MEREKQARQAIIDWQYDGSEPETFEVGFLEGVKWADKTMIDKACEWLEDKVDYCEIDCGDEDKFINDFKQAMEL